MEVDKELLRKYHLEEAQKRFQQITEYSFITKPMLAEEGDEDQDGSQRSPQQNQDGGMNVQPQGMQGNDDMQNGGDMNMDQGGMPQQPSMQQPQIDPTKDGGQNGVDMGSNDGANGDDEIDADFDVDDNADSMQPDDEVIDVDELTKAQETSEVKIDGVSDKLQDMLTVMNKFIAAIDNNDKKIDDLRAEFERRNPSEEEKINIRSQASAPYSETPKDYWDKKSQNSNYNVIYNNDVDPDKEEQEYVIRKSDLNNINDRTLAKSLDYPTKLENFINF